MRSGEKMIAVCGECLIDFIPQSFSQVNKFSNKPSSPKASYSQKTILPNYGAFIGGSPLNTAVAISRLKTPVTMISRLSKDAFGKAIIKHLKLNQVNTKILSQGNEPTTISFVIPQKKRGEDYIFYAQKSADRFFQIKDLPQLPNRVVHLHFSSIALQMEPCGTTYEHLMKKEFRRRTISLDPNVRPLFIDNRKYYLQKVERMIPMTGVFRASDQDLKYLYPRRSPETVIKKILPCLQPPGIVTLTQGDKGTIVFFSNSDKKIKAIKVPIKKTFVIDTVGAGDSFTGAFLHILHQYGIIGNRKFNLQSKKISLSTILKNALEFAIQAATINCSRKGCDPAFLKELNLSK